MTAGSKYLHKFGWFGTSFGGPTAWLFGNKYQARYTIVKDSSGELWTKDERGLWQFPVKGNEKFLEGLKEIKD